MAPEPDKKSGLEARTPSPRETDDTPRLRDDQAGSKNFDARSLFFQFPLCALAFATHDERIQAIIWRGCVEAGEREIAADTRPKHEQLKKPANAPDDYHSGSLHRALVLGANQFGVEITSIADSLDLHGRLDAFLKEFTQRHGVDATVRIRADLLVGDAVLPYQEFSVFAAIVSVVGNKSYPVLITRPTIQNRALGYRSRAILDAELAGRTDGAKPLTARQISYTTIRHLQRRGLVARNRLSEAQTVYQIRMSQKELDQAAEAMRATEEWHQQRIERERQQMCPPHAPVPPSAVEPSLLGLPQDAVTPQTAPREVSERKFKRSQTLKLAEGVLEHLNHKAGRSYRPVEQHLSPIADRLEEVGLDTADVSAMLDRQCELWKGNPIMDRHMTVATLFSKSKFHEYYDSRDLPVNGKRTLTDADHQEPF